MARLLEHPFAYGPWWLQALTAAAAVVCAAELVYIRWSFKTSRRQSLRALKVQQARADRAVEDFWWNVPRLRELEAAQAIRIRCERVLAERPTLMLALLNEREPLKAVAS